MPCSNATKTQNPLKFVGVPQTPEPISAVSGPKFTILSGHVDEVLLLNNFFPIVDTCLSWPDKVVRWCRDGDFFASCICSEPRAAHFRHAFYTLNHKKCDILFLTITLAKRNRFLHHCNREEILQLTVVKIYHITLIVCAPYLEKLKPTFSPWFIKRSSVRLTATLSNLNRFQ